MRKMFFRLTVFPAVATQCRYTAQAQLPRKGGPVSQVRILEAKDPKMPCLVRSNELEMHSPGPEMAGTTRTRSNFAFTQLFGFASQNSISLSPHLQDVP